MAFAPGSTNFGVPRQHFNRGARRMGLGLVLAGCGGTPSPSEDGIAIGKTIGGDDVHSASDEGPGQTESDHDTWASTEADGDSDSGVDASDGPDDSDDDGDDPRFDLGGLPDRGTPGQGCSKVDFLFVIDSSGSMLDEQQNLINSFPGFISAIKDTLEITDFQIMAVDTDWYSGKIQPFCFPSSGSCECPAGSDIQACCAGACSNPDIRRCNGKACDEYPSAGCEHQLGSGNVTNLVDGRECMLADGRRYMTGTQTDLVAAFSCAARMGTGGHATELPMDAMVRAVGAQLGSQGECNEGFIRRDAVLVVTVITDEEDLGKSTGDPQVWHAALVAAKAGNEAGVVVLGLIGDLDLPAGICDPLDDGTNIGAEASPNLRKFVRSFGAHGLDASVCAPDYRPFFEDAVRVIDQACDDFIPPE